MSDTQNLQISKNDWIGAYVPKHTAKLIKAGIENGTAPFIPNNGQLKPSLIYNVNTEHCLEAKDLIPVQLTKIEKGYESDAVGTYNSASKADTKLKKGERGIYYNFVRKDGQFDHNAFYFAEQMESPEKFSQYAKKHCHQTQNLKNETLKISSPDVTEYLGTYVAACKSGAKLEVTPEISEQFKTNMLAITSNELARTNAEKNPNIPKMSDVLFDIEKYSSNIVKNREKELGIGQKQEKPEQQRKPKEQARKVEQER
ncbi:MAG: ArdC family protein [Treponema sp.]|nr:ArdC family protein [Treponema sp.]